jgi:hypothetical protein
VELEQVLLERVLPEWVLLPLERVRRVRLQEPYHW